jgi:hypothetical protein
MIGFIKKDVPKPVCEWPLFKYIELDLIFNEVVHHEFRVIMTPQGSGDRAERRFLSTGAAFPFCHHAKY